MRPPYGRGRRNRCKLTFGMPQVVLHSGKRLWPSMMWPTSGSDSCQSPRRALPRLRRYRGYGGSDETGRFLPTSRLLWHPPPVVRACLSASTQVDHRTRCIRQLPGGRAVTRGFPNAELGRAGGAVWPLFPEEEQSIARTVEQGPVATSDAGSERTLGGAIGVSHIDFQVWRVLSPGVHEELRIGRQHRAGWAGDRSWRCRTVDGTDSSPLSVENMTIFPSAVNRGSNAIVVIGSELPFVRAIISHQADHTARFPVGRESTPVVLLSASENDQ